MTESSEEREQVEENLGEERKNASESGEDYVVSKKRKQKGRTRKQKGRKRKRNDVSGFLDIAAESSDEEEEANVSEGEIKQDEADRMMAEYDRRRKDRFRYPIESIVKEGDEQEMRNYMKDLEEKNRIAENPEIQSGVLIGQINLPSVSDPSLWLIKCKKGAEKLACIALMQKSFVKLSENDPLMILSATCLSYLKGYIYVEAFKEAHVRKAVAGLHFIGNKVSLVPLKEMADIYTMAKAKKKDIKIGDWVRVKSGLYENDLAQVVELDSQKTKATIKLIPRLKLNDEEVGDDEKKTNPQAARLAQRMFDPKEFGCTKKKRHPRTQKMFYTWSDMNFRKGFLYKEVNLKSLHTEKIHPSLEELIKFKPLYAEGEEESSDDEKIDTMILKQKRSSGIAKGDKVQVISGDLRGMKGAVVSINENLVTVTPFSREISGNLQFEIGYVEKFFQQGDYVRVVHGLHKGEAGLITFISGSIIHIYSESKRKEIQVLASDVQSGAETKAETSPQGSFYRANDLLIYNGKSYGVVLSVERDCLNVIDSSGEIKTVRMQDVQQRKETDRIMGIDSMRNNIQKHDSIRIVDGENKGRKATIVHIFKNVVFLFNPEQVKDNGLFVDRPNNLLILGAELLRANPEARERGNRMMGNPKRDELFNKLVSIILGPFKGYQGKVVGIDRKNVKVELSSKPKIVNVARSDVRDAAEAAGVRDQEPIELGSRTPGYVPQSPQWQPSTPGHQSPGFEVSGWNQS